jgi:hypothetical protein
MADPIAKCIDGNCEYGAQCVNWNGQFRFLNGRSLDAALQRKTL